MICGSVWQLRLFRSLPSKHWRTGSLTGRTVHISRILIRFSLSTLLPSVACGYLRQDTMQDQNIGGKGYGMIIDGEGMIIAHKDPEYNGKYLRDVYGDTISDSVLNSGDEKVNALIDGEHCTLFISPVLGQWYVTVVISDSELFEELRSQIVVNILISLGIFALISLFYYLSYRNEQAYSKKMGELNISRQKQEYEAEVLRLEKLAADEANKAKGSFLADMSHEIRTPISPCYGKRYRNRD